MPTFDKTEGKKENSRASANQNSESETQSFSLSPPPLQFKEGDDNEAESTGVIAWMKKNPGKTALGVATVAAALGWYFFSSGDTSAASPGEALETAGSAAVEAAPPGAIEVILDKVADDAVDAAVGNSIGSMARATAGSLRAGMDASEATYANLPVFDAKGPGFD